MVIDNFDIVRCTIEPFKTDSILVVNSNTALAISVADQHLQSVSRRHLQIIQKSRRIELLQFSCRDFPQLLGTRLSGNLRVLPVKYIFCPLISKRPYHVNTVSRYICYVDRFFGRTFPSPAPRSGVRCMILLAACREEFGGRGPPRSTLFRIRRPAVITPEPGPSLSWPWGGPSRTPPPRRG